MNIMVETNSSISRLDNSQANLNRQARVEARADRDRVNAARARVTALQTSLTSTPETGTKFTSSYIDDFNARIEALINQEPTVATTEPDVAEEVVDEPQYGPPVKRVFTQEYSTKGIMSTYHPYYQMDQWEYYDAQGNKIPFPEDMTNQELWNLPAETPNR